MRYAIPYIWTSSCLVAAAAAVDVADDTSIDTRRTTWGSAVAGAQSASAATDVAAPAVDVMAIKVADKASRLIDDASFYVGEAEDGGVAKHPVSGVAPGEPFTLTRTRPSGRTRCRSTTSRSIRASQSRQPCRRP